MSVQTVVTNTLNRLFPKAQRRPFTVGEVFNGNIKWDDLTEVQTTLWIKMKPGQAGSSVHPMGHWFNFTKLSEHKVAPTVPKGCGNAKFCHWDYPKGCSIGHYKLLGSFPEWYEFVGNYGMAKQRIGNSVPPLFMKAIATQIKHVMFGGEPLEDTSTRNEYLDILDEAWQQHLEPRADNAPTVISTFAGCGGSSLGYSMAGFRELLAVEWDDNAVETFKLNFPNVPVYHGDIAKLSVDECLSLAGIQPGELDIFDGSPPCQGFSTAGKRVMDDERNQLFREYVRLLRGLKPKVFVMENVSGMVKGKMKLIFAEVMKELKASGYQVKCQLMNAMYFNVPQSRQRLIFIGVRDDLDIEPTHPKAERKPFTVGEAIDGGEVSETPTSPRLETIMPYIKQGHDVRSVPISILKEHYPSMISKMARNSFANRVRRVYLNKPHPVIGKQFIMCDAEHYLHPLEDRYFSSEELARLGSFHDNFIFLGGYKEVVERIGNSVPPLFMRSIARHIRTDLLTPTKEA